MKINWKVRFKSKTFLIALFSLTMLLGQQVTSLFGLDINIYNEQITDIFNTILSILVLVGVVADHSTRGIFDSKRVMMYTEPRKDEDKW